MDLQGFGNSSDGVLTISSNITETVIDSAASLASASKSCSATNASFAAGKLVFLHQSQGTGAGSHEFNFIDTYVAGTITMLFPSVNSYSIAGANKAQVRVVPQYQSVDVQSGKTYTVKAWNGTVGGILMFMSAGSTTITGSINGTGKGYRGGSSGNDDGGTNGEGIDANPGSLGAGQKGHASSGSGGGAALVGGAGSGNPGGTAVMTDSTLLTNFLFGPGGGGGTSNSSSSAGAPGGAIIYILSQTVAVTGSIVSNGSASSGGVERSGGGGAGGCIRIRASYASIGTNLLTVLGGVGGSATNVGGTGSVGRLRVDACQMDGSSSQGQFSSQLGGFSWCQSFIHIYG